MFLTTSRRSAPSKFRTTLPPALLNRRRRRQAAARQLALDDDARSLEDARAVVARRRQSGSRVRRAASASAGETAGLVRVRRRGVVVGAAGVARGRRAGRDEEGRDRHGGAQGGESSFHCHFHRVPRHAGPGLSPEVIAWSPRLLVRGCAFAIRLVELTPAGIAPQRAAAAAPARQRRRPPRRRAAPAAARCAAALRGPTPLGQRLRRARRGRRRRGRRGGRGAAPAAPRRRGAAGARRRRAATVGRGLVPTLSISSSDSSPSVKLDAVRLHFGHEHAVDRVAGQHAPRLVAGDLAQECRALAVDHQRAGERELAALQPAGGGLRRRTGAGRRVGLKSVRCTISVCPAAPPAIAYSGSSDATTGFGAIGSAGAGRRSKALPPAGFPADDQRRARRAAASHQRARANRVRQGRVMALTSFPARRTRSPATSS